MTNEDKNEFAELKPLEITSPRTAEQPGTVTSHSAAEDACCSGHQPKKKQAHAHDHNHDGHSHAEEEAEASYGPTILSLVLLFAGIACDYFQVSWFSNWVRILVYGSAYALVGWRVVWHAVQSIRNGSVFNEFFLMTVATVGAFYIGEYAEGVAVMLFYVLGEHFQEAAVARSRQSIKALIDNRPEHVGWVQNGQVIQKAARQMMVGDIIQLKAGEKVALDGELLSATASFNTAALTGESKPDTKTKGETVLAGMINLNTVVELKVTSTYEDSALSKILQLVEQASSRKAKPQQFITRFAKVYTPIVVFLALGLTLLPYFFVENYQFQEWLYRALIFLVISCPCALVISIPLGYFGGIGAASRNGILFKGSNFLDLITKVDAVVMDKTGTLTEGVFQVQSVQAVAGNPAELVALTAALESKSSHPIALAIVNYAQGSHRSLIVAEVEEIAGQGLKGKVAQHELLAGNARLLRQFNIPYDLQIDAVAETTVLVAIDRKFAGYITIADQLKPDAWQAVDALRQAGIKKLVLLSGDKDAIVQNVARTLKIDQAFGGLLPQDKVSNLERLQKQGNTIAFVGDGINDAPAITLADVGMAMGGLGSDAAIATADVVIQTDQPSKVATAIQIGKQTNRIVWQNIGLAFGVKALVLALGAFGFASMWGAVFADVGVAFLAILNAIRIQRMKF
jgi:Cd2+/Zn2+-exporting ATPase